MTLNKIRGGDLLAGLGGIALLVILFVPWYEFLPGVYNGTRTVADDNTVQSAWEAFSALDVALTLIALLGIVQLVTTAFERTTAYPVAAEVFLGAIGALVTIWTAIRVLNPPGPNFAADLRWGAWAGLVLVIAVTAGAWWSMRDEVRP